MKKIVSTIALSSAILLTAVLCGCNTNSEGTDSNGGVVNSAVSSMMSRVSSAMDSSSNRSNVSSNTVSSDTDDDLVSPVFWADQRYY